MSSPEQMEIDLSSPTPKEQSNSTNTTEQFTPSRRIQDLNEVDALISSLLSSASSAISLLSSSNTNANPQSQPLQTIQSQFQAHSKTYFTTLSTIEVRLRRQVYALEEANLIPTGTERDTRRGRNLAGASGASASDSGAGGGPLDPSWLNARINNGVEEGKKKELLDQGRVFVEQMRRRKDKNEDEEGG